MSCCLCEDRTYLDSLPMYLILYKSNIRCFIGFDALDREKEEDRLLSIVYYGGMLLKLFL
jgi:hypothetical protein